MSRLTLRLLPFIALIRSILLRRYSVAEKTYPLQVYQLTGSGFDLSKLSIFQIIPILLISPLAGVVIDRFRRKNVLIAADVVRALLILGLAIAPNLAVIYAIAALVAIATTFFRPTVQAVIPALVREEELLAAMPPPGPY